MVVKRKNFTESLQRNDCNAVFTFAVNAEAACFDKRRGFEISGDSGSQCARAFSVNNSEFIETRSQALVNESVKLNEAFVNRHAS